MGEELFWDMGRILTFQQNKKSSMMFPLIILKIPSDLMLLQVYTTNIVIQSQLESKILNSSQTQNLIIL